MNRPRSEVTSSPLLVALSLLALAGLLLLSWQLARLLLQFPWGHPLREPLPDHPRIRLVSSSFESRERLRAGDLILIKAITNEATSEARPLLHYYWWEDSGQGTAYVYADDIPLYDDGTHGDETANDGVWHLDYIWRPVDVPPEEIQLELILKFTGDFQFQTGFHGTLQVVK